MEGGGGEFVCFVFPPNTKLGGVKEDIKHRLVSIFSLYGKKAVLRSGIIFMRLRLLPYYIATQLFENEQKLIIGFELLCPLNFV
jgi:hypothetical protein